MGILNFFKKRKENLMILEQFIMTRYSDGFLRGSAKFKGRHGSIELVLDGDKCQAVLRAVGPALVETAKGISQDLMAETIEATGLMEDHTHD